jgi:hypothetical protein
MKQGYVALGFVMCFFGLVLGFVYFNPYGFVVDGLGSMFFLYGLFAHGSPEQDMVSEQGSMRIADDLESTWERSKCENCVNFGRPSCPRKEKLLNASPCEKFLFDRWRNI